MTLLAYNDGTDCPDLHPAHVLAALGNSDTSPTLLLGFLPRAMAWLAEESVRGRTVMAGYGVTPLIESGRFTYVPLRLSAIPRFLRDVARPDVAVLAGVRRSDGSLAYAENVGWGPAAARHAARVVVQVRADAVDFGGPVIEHDPAHVEDTPAAASPPGFRPPDAIDRAIASNVMRVLPDDPCIQLGPGGVPDAIVAALDRPVRVWSGVITDSVVSLVERGLVREQITAAYTWGGAPIRSLAGTGRLRMVSVEETHDITRLSSIERFVGLNTAVQLGLDGSVNVQSVGGRLVAGIGGHADFCAGASRSPGGLSIVALRSTAKSGASTIVERVDVVSTPHCDVEVVVTEHGIADLRGIDAAERQRRIIDVAAPEHRPTLRAAVS